MAPPALIFVVRHGNRLDVADKHWHLTSPTPYDPPLTYSGWAQSRAVGTQISNILKDRSAQGADALQPGQTSKRPKRYRIVIHTSPFLRCIQTSIAISAGLMARPSLMAPAKRCLSDIQISQLAQTNGEARQRRTSVVGKKTVLRIDAFLGEWLSPTYFELITPPPGSVMMLASSKASLLKAEDYKNYPHLQTRTHSNSTASAQPPRQMLWAGNSPKPILLSGSSPSATGSTSSDSSSSTSPFGPLHNLGAIQDSLPKPTAASSVEVGAYDPPVPAFSMAKNSTIPAGYVNHAKDACVVVDYQWDSMRAPYDWGDGGYMPEDWPDMHKRFKKGLQGLVNWYATAEDPASAVTTEYIKPGADGVAPGQPEDDEDENVETVVILVSHGAGCNAMIGAITHKPALMDIPISSLTMAALKSGHGAGQVAPGARPGSTIPLHQTYDLVLKASTDHLRPSSSASNTPRAPNSMANVYGGVGAGVARGRSSNSFSSPSASPVTAPHTQGIGRSSSMSGSLAAIRRGLRDQASSRGLGISAASASSALSVGLWSPNPRSDSDYSDEEAIVLDGKPASPPTTRSPLPPTHESQEQECEEQKDQLSQLPARTSPGGGGKGLWISDGSAQPPFTDAAIVRDQTPSKRRWTVTDRA